MPPKQSLRKFFLSFHGNLTLTYTLVTVLALLSVELVVLLGLLGFILKESGDRRQYIEDVQVIMGSLARKYLAPGQEDLPGLQAWLGSIYTGGYASLPSEGFLDSPAAPLVQQPGMLVLSADQGTILACIPNPCNDYQRGVVDSPYAGLFASIDWAQDLKYLKNEALSKIDANGNYQVAIAVSEGLTRLDGVIYLTIEPIPQLTMLWPSLLAGIKILLATGLLLLVTVTPFGALFGFLMSRRLAHRLADLDRLAESYGKGDFSAHPLDRSPDEIGQLGERLRQMAERIQNLLESQQELAMLEERNRIARELHDTVKQNTFATLMQIRTARNLLSGQQPGEAEVGEAPEASVSEVQTHLGEAEKLTRASQQELGLILAELKPAAIEGLGLAGALQVYLGSWSEQTAIPSELLVQGERRLPLTLEQSLYRVAQEALANVARHSDAAWVKLRLDYTPESLTLVVQDNGQGFDPAQVPSAGYGLKSMQERVKALHGELRIASQPGQGTVITVMAPVDLK